MPFPVGMKAKIALEIDTVMPQSSVKSYLQSDNIWPSMLPYRLCVLLSCQLSIDHVKVGVIVEKLNRLSPVTIIVRLLT